MSVVHIASQDELRIGILKVKSSDTNEPLDVVILICRIECVATARPDVATQAETQVAYGVVVHAHSAGIVRRHLKLVGTTRTAMNPVLIVKAVCIQSRDTHHFVPPVR